MKFSREESPIILMDEENKRDMTIRSFTKISTLPFPVEALFSWHKRPGAINRLTPPWVHMDVIKKTGGILPDATVSLLMGKKPFQTTWHARHILYEENRMFRDMQTKGPFSRWTHTHLFHERGPSRTDMEDHIEYALPFHPIGTMMAGRVVDAMIDRMFTCRHHVLAHDMRAHEKAGLPPLRILVSGASGLIGSSLVPFLTTGGHEVFRLVRKKPLRHDDEIFWDPAAGIIDTSALGHVDVVIHLAGENIGEKKWTPERKKLLIDSRIKSTTLLAKAVSALSPKPELFINASAIGFYGDRGEQPLTEKDDPGDLYIAEICRKWEEAAVRAVDPAIRTVLMRIGIGLSPKGGALGQLLFPFQAGLGASIGRGNQVMSWIGIDDILDAFLHVITVKSLSGPVNAVSPTPVTNGEFTRTLANVLNRPAWFRIPEAAIDLVFGEMGREILLSSTNVLPEKLVQTGFEFRHPSLEGVLRHLLGKY